MANRNRILGLQRATKRSLAFRPMAMKARDRLARRAAALWRDTERLDGALCRRHAAGSGRLFPPGPRRLAPHELADADAGGRRQPRARRRSRAQQGGGGRVARDFRDGERLCIDEIGQHGLRRRIIADTYLHLRLLFQPLGGERGDQRRRGERGFRREIRGRERSRRRPGQPFFRRRFWPVFQPTRSRSAPTRSPVLPERPSVRSRRSSSATPTNERGIDDRRASDGRPLRSIRQPSDPSAPAQAQPKRRRPWPLRLAEHRRRLQRLGLHGDAISQARAAPVTATPASALRSAIRTPSSRIWTPGLTSTTRTRRSPASSADPPAVNVRKGYLPGHKANAVDWCTAAPASATSEYYTYPSDRTVGTVTKDSAILTEVASTTGITTGEPIVDAAGALASTSENPVSVSGSGGSTITSVHPSQRDPSFRRPDDRMDDQRIAGGRLVSEPRRRRGRRPVGLRRLLGHQSSARPVGRDRRDCARRRVRNPAADNGEPLSGLPI